MNIKRYKNRKEKSKTRESLQNYILFNIPGPTPPDPPEPPDPPTPPTPGQFNPWLSNPGTAIIKSGYFINKYAYSYGLNECVTRGGNFGGPSGWVLPNCTGYAWGRVCYMMGGNNPHLSNNNASRWYAVDYGGSFNTWPRSQTPSLGAVACWYETASDGTRGPGHVAVVEAIHYTGGSWDYLTLSESGYSGSWYSWNGVPNCWDVGGIRTRVLYANNTNPWGYPYSFQGFINTPSNLIVQ